MASSIQKVGVGGEGGAVRRARCRGNVGRREQHLRQNETTALQPRKRWVHSNQLWRVTRTRGWAKTSMVTKKPRIR